MGYIEKVLALGATVTPGSGHFVNIRHDSWCPKLRGGPCTCEPDLEVLTLEEWQRRTRRNGHKGD